MNNHTEPRYQEFAVSRHNIRSVKFLTMRGGRLSWLDRNIKSARFKRAVPSIIVLNIGGNDLDSSASSPQLVGLRLYECAKFLVGLGVKQVAVCQIVPRSSWRYLPTLVGNDKVDSINEFLEAVCNDQSIFFWKHDRIPNSMTTIHRDDGVHFNDSGNKLLFRSVRGALLFAAKRIAKT